MPDDIEERDPFKLEEPEAIARLFNACVNDKDAWQIISDPEVGLASMYKGNLDFSNLKDQLKKIADEKNLVRAVAAKHGWRARSSADCSGSEDHLQ